ncbi:carbonate dehydratase [Spirosoma utsteinense]|uniref:carbonic anhydrase n=1 Tax=Spirosoma utsteinense TaxID=2585773 RepID=A0ABR6WD39_9BACT|nr:carbonate dehydratase [Spirosoma utsteinense]MBC3788433.1 carbonic anhydrase [Spirosoma utsteinense]MBC3794475.1 carbonic anhydrase [Spirosoma utsteinense]
MIRSYQKLFANNKKWVLEKTKHTPYFFHQLAAGQQPNFLWIGCSDSRVSAEQLTGTNPGDMFVHRNIANMVIHTDMSMLSVLDYAVNVLGVQHIIVCGHYGCGGVAAAMGSKQVGLIDNWLRHIKDVYRLYQDELDSLSDPAQRLSRLVELNIQEQVYSLASTSIVQNAWNLGNPLQIHGLVYDLKTGLLNDLQMSADNPDAIDAVYRLEPVEVIATP